MSYTTSGRWKLGLVQYELCITELLIVINFRNQFITKKFLINAWFQIKSITF